MTISFHFRVGLLWFMRSNNSIGYNLSERNSEQSCLTIFALCSTYTSEWALTFMSGATLSVVWFKIKNKILFFFMTTVILSIYLYDVDLCQWQKGNRFVRNDLKQTLTNEYIEYTKKKPNFVLNINLI